MRGVRNHDNRPLTSAARLLALSGHLKPATSATNAKPHIASLHRPSAHGRIERTGGVHNHQFIIRSTAIAPRLLVLIIALGTGGLATVISPFRSGLSERSTAMTEVPICVSQSDAEGDRVVFRQVGCKPLLTFASLREDATVKLCNTRGLRLPRSSKDLENGASASLERTAGL